MKRALLIVLTVALVVCAVAGLVACKKDDGPPTIAGIALRVASANTKFKVGEKFSTGSFDVYAIMSDGSERKVINQATLTFDKSDFIDNPAKPNVFNKTTEKFLTAGTYTLGVQYLSSDYTASTTFTVDAE